MTTIGRHNITRMTSFTTGTSSLTLANASPGCLSFADGGVVDGEILTYTIRDGTQTEVGYGTYTASGTTLGRDTVLSSTNSGNKISCSGNQVVEISIAAEDISPFAAFWLAGSSDTINNNVDDSTLSIDTERVDQCGITTLASNTITIAKKGWYLMSALVEVFSDTGPAFNGRIGLEIRSDDAPTANQIWFPFSTAHGITFTNLAIPSYVVRCAGDGKTFNVRLSNHSGVNVGAGVIDFSILKVANYA